jgi:hypothetical protein
LTHSQTVHNDPGGTVPVKLTERSRPVVATFGESVDTFEMLPDTAGEIPLGAPTS